MLFEIFDTLCIQSLFVLREVVVRSMDDVRGFNFIRGLSFIFGFNFI